MNVFEKILTAEVDQTTRLGNPLLEYDWYGWPIQTGPFLARMNAMSLMRGGNGFRQPKKGPKVSMGGQTRREREAYLKEVYWKNLASERTFRESRTEQMGWSTARINAAIEAREHLRVET